MSSRIKVMGEGGVHLHKTRSPEITERDGMHKHLFFIGDRLLMTDLSGNHQHKVQPSENVVSPEAEHIHQITVQTPEGMIVLKTKPGGSHNHEMQVGQTTLSGLHIHEMEVNGEIYTSILPSDLVAAVEEAAKAVPAFKDFKIRESGGEHAPLEMDFETVKRLNKSDFKEVLRKACIVTIIKSLSRLKDGFQIESLILTRERFTDIGSARRFVMDHGMNIKSSEEASSGESFVFRINSKDRFVESSLVRIRVTDGVTAVVGLFDQGEVGQQVQENKPEEAKAEVSLTENAVQTDNAGAKPVVEGTIDELQDTLGNGDGTMKQTLKEKFARTKAIFAGEKKAKIKLVKKNDRPVAPGSDLPAKKFVNWKDGKPIQGTALDQINQIAAANGITRKFVSVEYPQKRFVEFLTQKYETVHAVYEDVSKPYDEREYKSLHVKSDDVDAFIVSTPDGWRKSLVLFFDDEKKLDAIFKTEIKNYSYGAFQYRQTMAGPVLVPVEMGKKAIIILDEQLMANITRDTQVFFSEKSEKFFKDNEDDIDYKRGILMYGPPGNGKTTFIKHFILQQKDAYAVLCSSHDFDGDMGKFLSQVFGKDAKKIIVFEDVDSIASRYEMRSEFLNFLDGVNPLHKTLIIATTNYPGHLDEALTKRPSRFDQKYKIDLPNFEMRKKFLKRWFKDISDAEAADYSKKCEGFSGAVFKELFILRGLQDITIDEAIVKMREQMSDVRKSLEKADHSDQLKVLKGLMMFGQDEEHLAEKAKQKRKFFTQQSPASLTEKFKSVAATFDAEEEDEDEDPAPTRKLGFFEIFKQDDAKRIVTGPVLIPEVVDLQDDIISVEDIEKAAHNYLIKLSFHDDVEFLAELGMSTKSKRGFMHVEFNRKIALVESYCAPVEFKLNGRNVKAGTWVMSVKVFDDEAWSLVQAKKITGFSIGGRSKQIPEGKRK